jgi:sacsin
MFPDQFEPYCFFGCDFNATFPGTLFRFPLRSPALARRSEISKRVYSVTDVQANIDQLVGQLSNYVMFLRSVRRIAVYRLAEGQRVPVLVHEALAEVAGEEKINDQSLLQYFNKDPSSSAQSTNRDTFYSKLMQTSDDKLPLFSHRVNVKVISYDTQMLPTMPGRNDSGGRTGTEGNQPPAVPDSVASVSPPADIPHSTTEVEFLIVSGLRGGQAKRLACDPSNRHLKLVPMGSVAACLSRRSYHSSSSVVNAQQFPPLNGQTFCFLPLPVQTQLPVHTNAYWELSSNRRDIWRGEDTKGEAKLRSDWNNLVMSDVLAPLYARLIVKIAASIPPSKLADSTVDLLNLLPCPLPADIWKTVALSLFPLLSGESILYSKMNNGRMVPMKSAYLLESFNVATVSDLASTQVIATGASASAKASSSSSAAASAVSSRTMQPLDQDLERFRLETILLEENIPVVTVSSTLLKTLVSVGCVAGEIDPAFVRKYFIKQKKFCNVKVLGRSSTDAPPKSSEEFFSEVDRWNEDKLQSAVFLLQYCVRDLNKSNFSELIGLPLVPLINGCLGTVGDATDSPLFLASEVERNLLKQGRCNIIVGDEILGPSTVACIRDENFLQVSNVKSLAPLDLLKLLRRFIPEKWFASNMLIADRKGVVSDEWLVNLWTYVSNSTQESVANTFAEVLPMLPIVQPATRPPGSYVVKVHPKIPVLNSSGSSIPGFIVLPDGIPDILSELGVFSMDAGPLSSLTKTIGATLSKSLVPATSAGIVKALSALEIDGVHAAVQKWPNHIRDIFREFLMDMVLPKLDSLTDPERTILCSMPIWLIQARAPSSTKQQSTKLSSDKGNYAVIDSKSCLPPKDINSAFILGGSFLHLRSDRDRQLFKLLGVEAEPPMGRFYAEYIVPTAVDRGYGDTELDAVSVEVLQHMGQLESEHPGFSALVKNSAIFRSSSGTLHVPSQLYDPRIDSLTSLLPSSVFPAAIYDDISLLQLRNLGMNTEINCEGVLFAAFTIQSDVDAAVDSVTNSNEDVEPIISPVMKRARDLVLYCDLHMESLLREADPDGLAKWKAREAGSKVSSAAGTDVDSNSNDEPAVATGDDGISVANSLGNSWGQELRSRRWIPCHMRPPLKPNDSFAMPWPNVVHRMPVAAPLQCVSVNDMWLCSSCLRIASVDIKTPLLRAVLGWNKPVAGRNICAQLLEMTKVYEEAMLTTEHKSIVSNQFYQVLPRLMHELNRAFESEPQSQSSSWLGLLSNKAFIWIGAKFIPASKVAFRNPVPNINLEPYLFTVPPEYTLFTQLFKAAGVKDVFEAADLASITRQVARSQKGSALSPLKLEVSSHCGYCYVSNEILFPLFRAA